MKVTKTHLRKIIKEERAKLQLEQVEPTGSERMLAGGDEDLKERMASTLYELFVSELSFLTDDISPEQEALYSDWDMTIDVAGDEFRSLLLSTGVLASVVDMFAEVEDKLFAGQVGQ